MNNLHLPLLENKSIAVEKEVNICKFLEFFQYGTTHSGTDLFLFSGSLDFKDSILMSPAFFTR